MACASAWRIAGTRFFPIKDRESALYVAWHAPVRGASWAHVLFIYSSSNYIVIFDTIVVIYVVCVLK